MHYRRCISCTALDPIPPSSKHESHHLPPGAPQDQWPSENSRQPHRARRIRPGTGQRKHLPWFAWRVLFKQRMGGQVEAWSCFVHRKQDADEPGAAIDWNRAALLQGHREGIEQCEDLFPKTRLQKSLSLSHSLSILLPFFFPLCFSHPSSFPSPCPFPSHNSPNPEHQAQNTKHKTQNPTHGTLNPGLRLQWSLYTRWI